MMNRFSEKSFTHPKIRNVEFFPAEISGQKGVCVRDPLNLSGKILFFPYEVFWIVSLFDGQHSILDIQAEFMRRFGEILYREKVEMLISQLEDHFLLETDRFREAERKQKEAFQKSPFRPMVLAGDAYEKDPLQLQAIIEDFCRRAQEMKSLRPADRSDRLVGAVAPHIDYRRGGECYGAVHRIIQRYSDAEVFVILGTAHAPMRRPYTVTRKHFQTPWGLIETDLEFLQALEKQCPFPLLDDEFVHEREHSIELQLIFLRALRSLKNPLRIVPILCGSYYETIERGISPRAMPETESFILALRETLSRFRGNLCILASADLAHMGVRFGDGEAPSPTSLQGLAVEDRQLLEYVAHLDAEGFYDQIRRERDRRRICGLSPIYTLLRTIEAQKGEILNYRQAVDPETQSVVTFAGVAFFS